MVTLNHEFYPQVKDKMETKDTQTNQGLAQQWVSLPILHHTSVRTSIVFCYFL